MIEIVSPAPFLESCALLRSGFFTPPTHGRLASLQLARCETFGLVAGEQLLAVIGFWPCGDGVDEVFLVGRPAAEVAPHLVGLAHCCRLILAHRLHSSSMAAVAFVKVGHEPGRRLARLAGFLLRDGAPPGLERWERRRHEVHSGDVRDDGRRESGGRELGDVEDLDRPVGAGSA